MCKYYTESARLVSEAMMYIMLTTVSIVKSVFTARCYASAVLAMGLCLSVCLSQVGVLLKRLNDHTNNTTR